MDVFFSSLASPEFWYGAIASGVGLILTGLAKKFSEDLYLILRRLVVGSEKNFVEVDKFFNPNTSDSKRLAWVAESKVYSSKIRGYKFHPIDDKNNFCFRKTSNGSEIYKEYLMFLDTTPES